MMPAMLSVMLVTSLMGLAWVIWGQPTAAELIRGTTMLAALMLVLLGMMLAALGEW